MIANVSNVGFAVAGVGAALVVVGLVIGGDDEGDVALRVTPTGLSLGGSF